MPVHSVERKLAAVLAADVVGYSRLMGEDDAGTLARLKEHRRELIDLKISDHKGRVVKTTGDGILIEFPSVVEAVACAVAVQRGMAERNVSIPEDRQIVFRVGVNLGDIIVEDGDIHGDGVNVAARLEAISEPGGICVSGTVRDHIGDRLDLAFDDLGERTLKNIARPVRVYGVRLANAERTPTTLPAESQTVLALPDKPSLVVLPFQNMSGDPEQEYFTDGMVEEITTAIARFPWLLVIARNSAFMYKGKAIDVREVARELGVRYALEGSVRKAGGRVRITGQLIDTATNAHIWADRFDDALEDIFELQDRIATAVIGAIEPKLRLAEMTRASRKPTESLDAYDLYLRALSQSSKRGKENVAESVRLARQALELDPGYGPAMARIALSRSMQLVREWIPPSGSEVEEGIRMARQAIDGAGEDLWTLTYAGLALAQLARPDCCDIALAAIDRAIALNPYYALAFANRALVLSYMPDLADEAVHSAQQALKLSPLDPSMFPAWNALAIAHLGAGRYEAGLPWAAKGRRANGGLPALRFHLSLCGHLGRHEEASECLRELREIVPEPTVARLTRGTPATLPPEVFARLVEGFRKAGLAEE